MKKNLLLILCLWTWCLGFVSLGTKAFSSQLVFGDKVVEQTTSSQGGGGMEITIPYGYVWGLPGIQAKVSLPLEIYPWIPPEAKDIASGIKLHWGNRLILYGGNLSFGGPPSLLTSAAPTMTLNPLGAFSFPASSLTVGMPGLSEASSPYGAALVASVGKGFSKDRVNLWVAGSEKKRFFGGVAMPFQWKTVSLNLSSAVGVWFLQNHLLSLEDSWFSKEVVYGDIWLKGLVLEGRLAWNYLKLYTGAALVEQPHGGFGYWVRTRTLVEFPWEKVPLQVLAGIYGGTPSVITADGSKVRETFQIYVNPQFSWRIEQWGRDGRVQAGIAFGVSAKNTAELRPQLFFNGKLRGGLRFNFTGCSVDITGEWAGIRLNNFDLKRSLRGEEKYGGRLGMVVNQLVPNLILKIHGAAHYENRGGKDKDRIVAAGGLSCRPRDEKRRKWICFIPELTSSMEAMFSPEDGFLSATTEAKAGWNIQFPYVKVGAWVAVQLKHTTQ